MAEAEVSHTRGFTILEKPFRKPTTLLETPSASDIAMRLGTSSPTTMEKYETSRVMRTGASTAARSVPMPRPTIHAARGSDRLVAAKAELANPTSVMATWMAARKSPGSSIVRAAAAARASPSSASWSSTTFLAVDSAISDIEKYPLASVSRNVTMMLRAMSIRSVNILLGRVYRWACGQDVRGGHRRRGDYRRRVRRRR